MARKWAAFYRFRGMQPLPSRPDDKRPMLAYADLWESPAPTDLFDRFQTSNIQIVAGRYWRLLVIDLDGDEARERWAGWGRTPDTWVTHSGGGGWHLWFRLPAGYPAPLRKSFLWRGDGEHRAIERLCDRSLVMAPPSIHPATAERYRFLDPRHSPKRLAMPADCPAWILGLEPLDSSPPAPHFAMPRPKLRRPDRPVIGPIDRERVLASIPDKIGLARSWGVQFAGRPSQSGWVPCHAVDREDRNPSAAIHAESGQYVDLGSGLRLSLFDLGVFRGVYRDWRDAATDLEAKHGRP